MERIIEGRGTGKTLRLMQLAKEKNAIFVCGNPNAMAYKAKAYGITGLNIMSYGEYWAEKYGIDKIVIDELESFIRAIASPDEIIGYTLSNED